MFEPIIPAFHLQPICPITPQASIFFNVQYDPAAIFISFGYGLYHCRISIGANSARAIVIPQVVLFFVHAIAVVDGLAVAGSGVQERRNV